MSQQPVNQPRRHGYITHRDAIWAAIRQLRDSFTTRDIEHACGVDHSTIKNYVHGLDSAGYLVVTGNAPAIDKPGQSRAGNRYTGHLYRLTTDTGVHAPMINKHGHQVATGQGSRALWSAMRVLGHFTVSELIAHSHKTIAETTVKSYLKHLHRAGYLAMQRQRGGAHYHLVRNTGPLPPMIQRSKAVYDPNRREVAWQRPEGDILDVPVDMVIDGNSGKWQVESGKLQGGRS